MLKKILNYFTRTRQKKSSLSLGRGGDKASQKKMVSELTPRDNAKINRLVSKREDLENKIEDIDDNIVEIQESARTTFARFSSLHNYLRQKYKIYNSWHSYKYANTIHVVALALTIILAVYLVFLWGNIQVRAASEIDISGSCKQYDQATNCTDSEVVKVAVNGTLAGQTGSTSSGTWNITTVSVNAGDILTIFTDNVDDTNEAVAVVKVAAVPGNISGVLLYERHLTIGSSTNETITNSDLGQYDNSVSSDEDIFIEVDANNDLTIPATSTQTTTDQELYILASNTYRPDSGSSGNISVPNFEIPSSAIFTADGNVVTLTDDGTPFTVSGTFTAGTSTIKYTGAGNTNVTATTYYHLETKPSGEPSGADWVIGGAGDASYNGDYSVAGTHGGKTYYVGPSPTNNRYLFWEIYSELWLLADALEDATSGYSGTGADLPANPWSVWLGEDMAPAPTLSLGVEEYTYTLAIGTINVEGNYVNGDGTNGVTTTGATNDPTFNIDGTFTNSADATFIASDSGTFSVGGNFSNNASGTFTHSSGTLTLDGQGTQSITTAGDSLNNVVVSNTSAEVSQADASTIAGTLTINSGAIYDINGQNITLATLANSGTFRLQGGETTVTITTKDTDSGTVEYDGTGNYTGFKYGNTYFGLKINKASGTGTITMDAAIQVNGVLTLANGTLDTSGTNYAINIGTDATTDGAYSQTGGTLTANDSTTTCYGDYSITGGTYTAGASLLVLDATPQDISLETDSYTLNNIEFKSNSSTAARTVTLGSASSQTLAFAGYFYVNAANSQHVTVTAATYSPTVNISGNVDYTGVGAGTEYINFGGGTWTASGDWITNGGATTYSGTPTLILNGSSKSFTTNHGGTGGNFYNVTIDGTINSYVSGGTGMDINGTLTVNESKQLTINATGMTAVNVLLYGTIDGSTSDYLTIRTSLNTGGTLNKPVRWYAGGGAPPARTYGSHLAFYYTSGCTWTLKSGTYDIGGELRFANIRNGTYTLDADANDPTMNIAGGITGGSGGSYTGHPLIKAGGGTWTVGGSIDFTSGNADWQLQAGTSTFVLNGTSNQSITSVSQAFYNLTVSNTSTSPGVTFVDALDVDNLLYNHTPSSVMTFTAGTTSTINDIDLNGADTATRITIQSTAASQANWTVTATPQTGVSYVSVSYNNATSGQEIIASDGTNFDGGNNDNWSFISGSDPVNNSVSFVNPYTSNVVVADNTTEWTFRILVTDDDGPDDIDYVEIRFANSSDASQPYDSLKYKWTQSTDIFSEVADTQDTGTITSTSNDSNSLGNQWTLDFKIKIDDDFLAKDTNYAVEAFVADDSANTDNDNYADIYQVTPLSISLLLDFDLLEFGNLLPGSILTGTTIVTVTTNYPNGYSLSIHDSISGSDSCLLHTDTTTRINDYSGTIEEPTSWTGTGLGICLYSATNKESKWGTGVTEDDVNNLYAGVPETITAIHNKTGSPTNNDQNSIGYKIVVPNTQKTGDYSGIVTYTVTGVLN